MPHAPPGRPGSRLPRHVDHGHPFDEPWQRAGHGGIEPADGLRSAEHEQDPLPRRDVHPPPSGFTIHVTRVADRGAGQVARPTGRGSSQRHTGRLERDRQRRREPGGGPDRATRDDVAVPQDDRDPQRLGSHQDRYRHVAAGREDRGRALRRQDRGRLRDRCGQPQADRSRRARPPPSCATTAGRGAGAGCRWAARGWPQGHGGRPASQAQGRPGVREATLPRRVPGRCVRPSRRPRSGSASVFHVPF